MEGSVSRERDAYCLLLYLYFFHKKLRMEDSSLTYKLRSLI